MKSEILRGSFEIKMAKELSVVDLDQQRVVVFGNTRKYEGVLVGKFNGTKANVDVPSAGRAILWSGIAYVFYTKDKAKIRELKEFIDRINNGAEIKIDFIPPDVVSRDEFNMLVARISRLEQHSTTIPQPPSQSECVSPPEDDDDRCSMVVGKRKKKPS
jgi:hypothetical protein